MPLPNFLIIGAAKSGTTAVARYLDQHPDVFVCRMKETDFFAYDPDTDAGLRAWSGARHVFPVRTLEAYAALFDDAGDARAVGEASPLYLESPRAAERIRETLPDVRLIALLRDPVARAWSGFLMNVLQGREDPAAGLTDASHYVRIGFYSAQVRRYLELFPRERIRIRLYDDLEDDPQELMRDLYAFLDVDPGFAPDLAVRHNVGDYPRHRRWNAVLRNAPLSRALGPRAPAWARRFVNALRRSNSAPPPPLPPEMRARLRALYRDDVLALQDLIGRDLGRWLREDATD